MNGNKELNLHTLEYIWTSDVLKSKNVFLLSNISLGTLYYLSQRPVNAV